LLECKTFYSIVINNQAFYIIILMIYSKNTCRFVAKILDPSKLFSSKIVCDAIILF